MNEAAKRTLKYFDGTYHCAESVACGTAEAIGLEDPHGLARCAAAFGGGVGKTEQEMCGALAGALMVLGRMEGRTAPSPGWQELADRAAEFREQFEMMHGSTQCQALLDSMGEQNGMDKCRALAANTATLLMDMLRQPKTCKIQAANDCC
ncbi:C-GCAxxG-C-C family protein [Salidesulfovibrio onnuriiensis]|uniref:C-GCAxxG-C-C family protein n=1 Tax=Salidesulfovibrio onnuriiensis TaxID=2583823 RepID=UPI0011CC41E2|nr:C-GCAxxG-C-C family protein [Salidesulfovibrio onnuriiensis]